RIPAEETHALLQRQDLTRVPLRTGAGYLTDGSQELGMVEVIVPAESTLLGQTVLQAQMRREYGLTVIGLRRGREVVRDDFLNEKLAVGDTLLLVGFWNDIKRLQSTSD